MEEKIEKMVKRLEEADRQQALVEMVDKAILKSTFHYKARNFIDTLIRQRQIVIRTGRSKKNTYEMLKTIDHLKVNLDAAGKKDRFMARFFMMNEEEIRSLIPGKYPSRYYDRFISLRDQAREIHNRQLSML